MAMSQPMQRRGGIIGLAACLIRFAESLPIWIAEIFFRLGVGLVFFFSGLSKIASWDITVALFKDEYKVPLLPPELAANMAAAVELGAPFLLWLGFGTRIGAGLMLGMTLVIQIFVYPESYRDHALWAGPLLYLLLRGPGKLSIDHLIRKAVMKG